MSTSMRHLLAVVAVGGALAAAVVVPASTAQAAPAAPSFAHCAMRAPLDHDATSWSAGYAINSTRLRSGSSTTCGTRDIISPGPDNDELDYYCYTFAEDGFTTWTYLRDVSSGVEGWALDDDLHNLGANNVCQWS